jgi:hypothetical protein
MSQRSGYDTITVLIRNHKIQLTQIALIAKLYPSLYHTVALQGIYHELRQHNATRQFCS